MHVNILQVTLQRRFIGNCCESSKSLFMNKSSQRTNSIHKNVNSQIKFQIINQQRLMDVSLNNISICFSKTIRTSNQEDSSTLTSCFRFHNEGFSFLFRNLLLKTIPILRQKPSWRMKFIFIPIDFHHLCNIGS